MYICLNECMCICNWVALWEGGGRNQGFALATIGRPLMHGAADVAEGWAD